MKRREQRETIFKLLFMMPFSKEEDITDQIDLYLDNLKSGIEEDVTYGDSVKDKDVVYIHDKLAKITEKTASIDELLNATSKGWKTTRMAKVDLSILRLAVYEMLYDEEVPVGVAINEAVELAKQYGGDESPAFINGILGQIARNSEKQGE